MIVADSDVLVDALLTRNRAHFERVAGLRLAAFEPD